MRRRIEDSVDAFLRNNNSTIRRISPEKMRNVLKINLNKCPRISLKKGQKKAKKPAHANVRKQLIFAPNFWKTDIMCLHVIFFFCLCLCLCLCCIYVFACY